MPKPLLNQLVQLDSVFHLNDWNINFTRLPSGFATGTLPQNLNIRAYTVDLPRWNVNPIQIDIRGHRFFIPGDKEFDSTITLQLHETTDAVVLEFFRAWAEAIYATNTGAKGNPAWTQLKGDIQMVLLDRQLNPKWEYMVYGVWVQSIDLGGQLTGDKGADIVRPTATLNFDWFTNKKL